MKNFLWCTDIHLDFIDGPDDCGRVHDLFAYPVSKVDCDGIFVTGDISHSIDLIRHLSILDRVIDKKIYFVLGNHDFYGGDFESVRSQVVDLCKKSKNLTYLSRLENVTSLTEKTAIVGHDGWYDALYGDFQSSSYIMTDWIKIQNFNSVSAVTRSSQGIEINKSILVDYARYLAFEAAEHIKDKIMKAASIHETVIVLTHVPPFPQLHKPGGKSSSNSALPWYTSKIMGDALLEVTRKNPNTHFEVFCGHTHGQFDAKITDNLTCHVGGSIYGKPDLVGKVIVS